MTDELKIKYRGLLATIELARGEHEQALAAAEDVLQSQRPAPDLVRNIPWLRRTGRGLSQPVGTWTGAGRCAPIGQALPLSGSANTPACFPSAGRAPAPCRAGTSGWLGKHDAAFRSWQPRARQRAGIVDALRRRPGALRDRPPPRSERRITCGSLRRGHDRSSAVSMRRRRWPPSNWQSWLAASSRGERDATTCGRTSWSKCCEASLTGPRRRFSQSCARRCAGARSSG